jgi:hypothetical protein
MFEKLKQFYSLFKQGEQVSNPAFWKKGQAVAQPIIAGLILTIVALAKGFGYELPISDDLAFSIAGAIFFAVNSVLTITTSRHIGLPTTPVREAEPSVRSAEQTADSNTEVATDETVPSVSKANAGQPTTDTIDEATRQRAIAWAREHSVVKPSINNSNGLASDA